MGKWCGRRKGFVARCLQRAVAEGVGRAYVYHFFCTTSYRCVDNVFGALYIDAMVIFIAKQALVCSGRTMDNVIAANDSRSEARSVGKECVSTCRLRWSPEH